VPGQVVRVVDKDGAPLGRAFWNPRATIALRMLTSDWDEKIDVAFFEKRIGEALRIRKDLLRLDEVTDGYRIVHAESDGLSGLIVDRMGDVVALEVFALGFARHVGLVREAIQRLIPGVSVVARADARSGGIEGFHLAARPDDPKATEVKEHGLRYRVDLETGHKTGFFFDQRDNRAFWGKLVRGLSVLDCHSYTGGFALNAAAGGAREVTGVDLDEAAIAVAKKNANLNQLQSKVRFVHSDAFPYLRDVKRQEKKPEAISLDPPKLARDKTEVVDALRIYTDLNAVALETIAPNGLFLSCSCSGAVTEEEFLLAIRTAAARTKRDLTILRVSGAAPDHPFSLAAPETRYLKAVFARVR
jgi:23S rRNA (cytosine1962-C5)-methyltransferase